MIITAIDPLMIAPEDGQAAVVYDVLPSLSVVPAVRTADGGYASATGGVYSTLTVGYKKSVGDTITQVANATAAFDGLRIYFRRRLRSTGAWESYYYSYANATHRKKLVITSGDAASGFDVSTYDMVELVISTTTAASSSSPAGIKDRQSVPVLADGASASFFWLRTSTSGVTVNADGTTTPTTFKVSIMKTEGGATTELTSWPTDLPNGLALEIYKDGTLYYSENSLSEWSSVMEGLRTGIPTSDFANASFFEFRLRAQRTTDVFDTKSINSVKSGTSAEFYALEIQGGLSSVDFSSNFAGVVSARPSQVTLLLRHVSGGTQEYLSTLPSGMTLEHLLDDGTWEAIALGARSAENDLSDGTYDTVYRLKKGSTVVSTVSLASHWSFQRMLLPAGVYANKRYDRTNTTTPLVLVDTGTHKGEYWFLDADTNWDGTRYVSPNDANQGVWAKADDFDVVLAKMLFAQFAQLGGFVVYDVFFFSQYGVLVSSNGAETIIDTPSKATTQYGGKVPYGWFDPSDPMPSGTHVSPPAYKFRPMKCINAKSGEEWAAGGNVHFHADGSVDVNGTIKTNNLFKSVALCWGQTATSLLATCTLEPGGKAKTYLYVKSLDRTGTPALAAKYGFAIGDYFEYTSEIKSGSDAADFEDGLNNADFEDNDFVPCTYSADLVELLDKSGTANYPVGGKVYLPLPSKFPGKRVEVRHNNTYGSGTATVTTVDPTQNLFVLYPILDEHGDMKTTGYTLSNEVTINPGQTGFFYSMGNYWLYFPSGTSSGGGGGGSFDFDAECAEAFGTVVSSGSYFPVLTSTSAPSGRITAANLMNNTISPRIFGSSCTAISSGADLNTLTATRAYASTSSSITNSLSNCPVTGAGFVMWNIAPYSSMASYGTQVLFCHTSSGGIFVRFRRSSSSWTEWTKIV